MVRRIVLIKLQEEHANEEGKTEVASRLTRELPSVDGVGEVEVLLPADARAGKDWDVCLIVTFESAADVQVYIDHPLHRALVDEFLRPRLAVIKRRGTLRVGYLSDARPDVRLRRITA